MIRTAAAVSSTSTRAPATTAARRLVTRQSFLRSRFHSEAFIRCRGRALRRDAETAPRAAKRRPGPRACTGKRSNKATIKSFESVRNGPKSQRLRPRSIPRGAASPLSCSCSPREADRMGGLTTGDMFLFGTFAWIAAASLDVIKAARSYRSRSARAR
jgi:hypothetical protein